VGAEPKKQGQDGLQEQESMNSALTDHAGSFACAPAGPSDPSMTATVTTRKTPSPDRRCFDMYTSMNGEIRTGGTGENPWPATSGPRFIAHARVRSQVLEVGVNLER
jgi:hypothetical protein